MALHESEIAEHRHRCEVRQLITWTKQRGRQAVVDYLDSRPVQPRAAKLRADLNEQLKRGNKGLPGAWIEQERGEG